MSRNPLLRECRAKLAGVRVPRPFSLEQLCAQVSSGRGRPLYLHPLPLAAAPDVPCGLWVATPSADHVFHAPGASALHQQNIILHEIGHMLCDHSMRDDGGGDLAALLTDLDPEMVRRVLLRTRYSTRQEEQAEMMAALILHRAGWTTCQPRPDGSLGRLSDALGLSRTP